MIAMQNEFRSGFVALVGRPNVGKSSLINKLIGEKVTIVSDKSQTTRHQIRCVLTRDDAQVIFMDTPGIHRPKHKLGERMVETARQTIPDADVVAFVIDIAAGVGPGDRYIAEMLSRTSAPVLLIANKTDATDMSLQDIPAYCAKKLPDVQPAAIIPTSAQTGEGVQQFLDEILQRLEVGPKYYPDDWITDQPERYIIAEFIRESALEFTREEVPHALAVVVNKVHRPKDKHFITVEATIYVERDSQRGIIIGKGGNMIRNIGIEARKKIEALLGSQIHLQTWVKVKRDWRNKEGALHEFGYDKVET